MLERKKISNGDYNNQGILFKDSEIIKNACSLSMSFYKINTDKDFNFTKK